MTTLFMIWLPTYLQEARGFSLTQMGVAASFPWLAICIAVLTAGSISDWLLNKGYSQLVARDISPLPVLFSLLWVFAALLKLKVPLRVLHG